MALNELEKEIVSAIGLAERNAIATRQLVERILKNKKLGVLARILETRLQDTDSKTEKTIIHLAMAGLSKAFMDIVRDSQESEAEI